MAGMFDEERLKEIERRRKEWEEGPLKRSLERFGVTESPNRFYTPLDVKDFDFLEKVGFPGEYPFAAGAYPTSVPGSGAVVGGGLIAGGGGLARAGRYSGYGTPEDTRNYYVQEAARGRKAGPNVAFDLPTQCGYDSDDPRARGEVGKTGVAVSTLKDLEVIFEAFTGANDLDRIASNFTINAPANIIIAMYAALAEKRRIPLSKLRGTPQNDILKEYTARGTYIFPPRHGMRMMRDSIVFCTEHMPLMNWTGMSGSHIRQAGATAAQTIAFSLCNLIAYVKLGIEAGLEVDSFAPRISFDTLCGDMEVLKEVAAQRAMRRMYAKIFRDRFGAENPRGWLFRQSGGALSGPYNFTPQRPLNNLTRAVLGGIVSAVTGGAPSVEPPYDEPLGLGWSMEAMQLAEDAARIIQHEARLCDVIDPFAGSYYIEALTDQVEAEAWQIIDRVEAMGGAVAAIESGHIQREIAKSAYEFQRRVETGERVVVGVNRFIGENEIEVTTTRLVEHPYDPKKREEAEERQIASLTQLKRGRDSARVAALLDRIRNEAKDESTNLMPTLVEAVKACVSVGEICGVLRDVFGEYEQYNVAA